MVRGVFKLIGDSRGHFWARVAVVTKPAIRAVWVSQLDDFLATVKLLYSKYNIGMTLDKTLIVRKSIIVARCASCNDILRAIVLTKNIPKLVLSEVNVIVDLIGTTMKGSDCDDRSSSLDMIVVSVILGECFLKNRAP